MKRTLCFSIIILLLSLFATNYSAYAAYSITIKLNFRNGFSESFTGNGQWNSVSISSVKDTIKKNVEDDYPLFTVVSTTDDSEPDTTTGVITVKIGVDEDDTNLFGKASGTDGSGIGSYTSSGAFCSVYSNNFAAHSEFQGANATVARIAQAIANTASHEAGHILGLFHAYGHGTFDPTTAAPACAFAPQVSRPSIISSTASSSESPRDINVSSCLESTLPIAASCVMCALG